MQHVGVRKQNTLLTGKVGFTLARVAKEQLTNLTPDSAHSRYHLNHLKAHYLPVPGKTPASLRRSTHLLKDKLVSVAENWCKKTHRLDKQSPIKILYCCKRRGAAPGGEMATATHTASLVESLVRALCKKTSNPLLNRYPVCALEKK